jgi:acetate kinase
MKILTLNCGSSSVKYGVWEMPGAEPLCQGIVERVTLGGSKITHFVLGSGKTQVEHDCPTHNEAIQLIFQFISHAEHGVIRDVSELGAVAHRVVHGGEKYTSSVLIDDDVIQAIEDNAVLAPLHNPNNLIGIRYAMDAMPDIPHTASWDTAFSAAFMPRAASIYAIPYEYYQDYGIRRYGYQGLSHVYVARRAAALMGKKANEISLVSLHVGNGSTVTAVKDGVPIDQSLGFSTCGEGLVMGTRCGDLDPGVPIFLMQQAGMSLDDVEDMIYRRSGVLGLTGRFVDRRDVIKGAEEGDERCQIALEVETYRMKKYIGSYAAAIGGIDAVVFTAGVGESSTVHRSMATEGLEFLGIKIDETKNAAAVGRIGETDISTEDSTVRVFVIPTDEELVMVEDALAIIDGRFDDDDFAYSFQDEDFIPTYLKFS